MERNGAQIIAALLERQGVATIAGIPGGAALPLYDAIGQSSIRHVLARHEQGAGFIAQGLARVTGRAGVCIATSGPGATNLLTAIADAKLDSIPLVVITAQVPTAVIGTDAFQEVDTYSLTLPIAKHNFAVRDAAELFKLVPEAFAIAESGRPGPVVIDVPKDVQLQTVTFDGWPAPWAPKPPASCDPAAIDALAGMIETAERPLLYIGGGVIAAGASGVVRELAQRCAIPVASTLHALGAYPPDDPLALGMVGMHGTRAIHQAFDEADLVIALGARFDDRATGKPDEFCPNAKVAHVDIDPTEIGKIVPADLAIVADVRGAVQALLPRVRERRREHWRNRVRELLRKRPAPQLRACERQLSPTSLIALVAQRLGPETIVTTDVGQHQMWVAQHYPVYGPRKLLTSGGLGTMGFGLPAAIGAALAAPERRVVCISGDGSILMNLQELATLAELGCNVSVIVMNNRHLGLVRQQQQLFYGERYTASRFDQQPDFAAIARGFGVRGVDLRGHSEPAEALACSLRARGPQLIDVPIEDAANVYPMVPPGAANRDTIEGHSAEDSAHG